MKLLVTGSAGLIGSEVCRFFHSRGAAIHGIDNNQRAKFFGPGGDTSWSRERLLADLSRYSHHNLDIRDRPAVLKLLEEIRPDAVVHAAGQPSHDLAARIPFDDFEINAVGTLNLLEAVRRHCPEAPFVHMSTNKVYGDRPNTLALRESDTRWEFDDPEFVNGIDENFPIDQSKHSLFGASKLASDILVQEYGRYFGMPTCCLRGGCLTGPGHSAVELHGFLSFLVKCNVTSTEYVVYGYKGKQVRDNIHSLDVARFVWEFIQAPRVGEVYNLGGGRMNSCSIKEAFEMVGAATGKKQVFRYVEENRIGDHICYYSDLRKIRSHYPSWDLSIGLEKMIGEIVGAWHERAIAGTS